MIDLSVPIRNTPEGVSPVEITRYSHEYSVEVLLKPHGLEASDLPDGKFFATERLSLRTHIGTHVDSPWHYGPTSDNRPAKTIDEIPLEWCYGNGVLLNFSHKKGGDLVTVDDVKEAVNKIGYRVEAFDIVLIRTDASKHYGEADYANVQPGMSREATLWLVDQGVKLMGIDARSWDRPDDIMAAEYKNGVKGRLWPAHFSGREKEFCIIENLVNLDQIPKPYGFKITAFPIKIEGASAGWARVVAIIEG